MTLQFPNNPSNGQQFTASNGLIYRWDGEKWITLGSAQSTGDIYVQKIGDTMTGQLVLPGGGTGSQAATVDQVDAVGTASVAKAGDTMTGDLTVPSLNGGPLAGFRNALINGSMEVFQRETGSPVVVSATSTQYVVDRWAIRSNVIGADTTITVQDITTSNHPPGLWKAIRLQNANVSVAPATGQFVGIQQRLEQSITRSLGFGSPLNQPLSIGFYIRSSVAATYTFSVQSAGSPRKSYLFDFDVPADETNWTYVSHSFPSNSDISFLTNDAGALVSVYLSSGSSFVGGTNESWNDSELFMTSNASNNFTTTPNAFVDLTGFQLEAGSVATPFEQRPIQTELALCQRYYQTLPEQTKTLRGQDGTALFADGGIPLFVPMRVTPTCTFVRIAAGSDLANLPVLYAGVTNRFSINVKYSGSGASGDALNFSGTADAEL